MFGFARNISVVGTYPLMEFLKTLVFGILFIWNLFIFYTPTRFVTATSVNVVMSSVDEHKEFLTSKFDQSECYQSDLLTNIQL